MTDATERAARAKLLERILRDVASAQRKERIARLVYWVVGVALGISAAHLCLFWFDLRLLVILFLALLGNNLLRGER